MTENVFCAQYVHVVELKFVVVLECSLCTMHVCPPLLRGPACFFGLKMKAFLYSINYMMEQKVAKIMGEKTFWLFTL